MVSMHFYTSQSHALTSTTYHSTCIKQWNKPFLGFKIIHSKLPNHSSHSTLRVRLPRCSRALSLVSRLSHAAQSGNNRHEPPSCKPYRATQSPPSPHHQPSPSVPDYRTNPKSSRLLYLSKVSLLSTHSFGSPSILPKQLGRRISIVQHTTFGPEVNTIYLPFSMLIARIIPPCLPH